jgi:two-component system sensor histidine kinase CreC
MTSLCNEILQSYTPVLQSKGLILRSDITDNLSLQGEQFLLHQAISNLLDNAIEHSPDQGAIDVSLTSIDNEIHLLVRNSGPNIPDFAMQRLFERFYSLPKFDNSKKGSGLGLCFVKEIIRLHQGKITLSNVVPTGVQALLQIPTGRDL